MAWAGILVCKSPRLQQDQTQPPLAGPSSPSNTPLSHEDARLLAFHVDLPDFGPTSIETPYIPEEEEFHVDFIDSQKNVYNPQIMTSEFEEDSPTENVEVDLDQEEGGGGLEELV